MRKALVALISAGLVACGSTSEDFGRATPGSQRHLELTAEERAQKLPNELFVAIWNGNSEESERLAKANPALLSAKNQEGDTAMGLALRSGRQTIAHRLLQYIPAKGLLVLNKNAESYVFLAARAGDTQFIELIAERHYQTLGALDDYEFADLDQENEQGERALFVAADRLVAEALETQYYRGQIELPFWEFSMKEDVRHRVFLHRAAQDGRSDLITWAAEHICRPGEWESSASAWLSWPSTALTYGLRGVQTHILGDWGLPTDVLFNRRDEEGQTPLHLAVKNRQWQALRALASCRWLDYHLPNQAGDYPLHVFLKNLDTSNMRADAQTRDAFYFLATQTSHLRLTQASSNAAQVDAQGQTALHLAARLADPFFFETLRRFGDVYVTDPQGQTALEIFENRREQVGR